MEPTNQALPQIDGECESCGYPGILDMTCPECGGRIIGLTVDKPKPEIETKEDDGRYSPDELQTVSLDDLAESELNAETEQSEENETL